MPTPSPIQPAAVQGGAGAAIQTTRPAAGWEKSLSPGEAVAGVLVSGDMSITGLGTVTYNDGKRILAFGHPFFNLGPVDMPMIEVQAIAAARLNSRADVSSRCVSARLTTGAW